MSEEITLRDVTKQNIRRVLKLKAAPEQERLAPTVAHMIARGVYEDNAWFKVVYADEEPVGFVKVWESNPEEPDLWGIMVDEKYQGRGYGRKAVELVITLIKGRNPQARRLCVGYLPENSHARAFYRKCGFEVDRVQQFDGWEEEIAYKEI
jgi:diamine N-acetyltransferase